MLLLRRLGRNPVALFAAALLALVVGAALFAPWHAPADPYKAACCAG